MLNVNVKAVVTVTENFRESAVSVQIRQSSVQVQTSHICRFLKASRSIDNNHGDNDKLRSRIRTRSNYLEMPGG